MVEMQSVVFRRENIKTDGAAVLDRDESDVRGDELRSHRQDIAPGCDPVLRVAPMALRRVSNLGQRFCVVGLGANDVNQTT